MIVDLDASTVILNNYKGNQGWMINTIILYIKQYIYARSCRNEPLNVNTFLIKLHQLFRLEGEIAMEDNKYNKYEKKWKPLITNW